MDAVPSGEPRNGIFPMLFDTLGQVRGDADVEGAVASAGQDVHEGAFQVILLDSCFRRNDERGAGIRWEAGLTIGEPD